MTCAHNPLCAVTHLRALFTLKSSSLWIETKEGNLLFVMLMCECGRCLLDLNIFLLLSNVKLLFKYDITVCRHSEFCCGQSTYHHKSHRSSVITQPSNLFCSIWYLLLTSMDAWYASPTGVVHPRGLNGQEGIGAGGSLPRRRAPAEPQVASLPSGGLMESGRQRQRQTLDLDLLLPEVEGLRPLLDYSLSYALFSLVFWLVFIYYLSQCRKRGFLLEIKYYILIIMEKGLDWCVYCIGSLK